jgi:hypothetical protein
LPIVIHHPVLSKQDSTWLVDPPWAVHGLLQAYRINGLDAKGGAPDSGGTLYVVDSDKLPAALSDGAILLADDLHDNNLGKVARSAIDKTWGVTIPGDVSSPMAAIVRIVGCDAHPDGLLGPKPIMPGSDGKFRWVVGRNEIRNIVPEERFFPALDRDGSHFAPRSHVRDVMLEGVKQAMEFDVRLGAKQAGMNLLKFGIRPDQVADFAKEMIPAEFAGVKPAKPETRYEVTFTAANGSTVAGFTKVVGAWSIVSNMLENDTPGADNAVTVRYDSALSGADHLAEVDATWESASSSWAAVCARYDTSDFKCYSIFGGAVNDVTGINYNLSAASATTLLTGTYSIGAQTKRMAIRVDGSTIIGTIDGSGHTLAATDTNLSNQVRVGMWARALTSGLNHKFDNLLAEDFSGGVPVAHLIGSGRIR